MISLLWNSPAGKTRIWALLELRHDANGMKAQAALHASRQDIETTLGKGVALKDFTLHNQDHSFRVVRLNGCRCALGKKIHRSRVLRSGVLDRKGPAMTFATKSHHTCPAPRRMGIFG